jgi:Domain of unknown function (DUF6475)
MQANESERFARLLTTVGYHYGKTLDPSIINQYWEALKGFPFAEVEGAFKRHACHPTKSDFMPKIGHLMRWLSGHPENLALQAWGKVCKALNHVGTSKSIAFDDQFIHAVIDQMGGWVMLGQMTQKDLPFRGQEFIKRYQYCVEDPPIRYPKYLMGATEQWNRVTNRFEYEVVAFGDDLKKVEQVIAEGTLTAYEVRRIDSAVLKKLLKAPPKIIAALEKMNEQS